MPHPAGGSGASFNPRHTFAEAYEFVGRKGLAFRSTMHEKIVARQSMAKDRATHTIVFVGERNPHGSTCRRCWGFRVDCNGSWIGQCAEALDQIVR
jgi:hypothetical protein